MRRSSYFFEYLFDDAFGFNGVSVFPCVFVVCWWCLQWYDSRMWILRLPEQHSFSTRPIVLPIFYVCYLQHWILFFCGSDGNFSCTFVSCAPTLSVLRKNGVFDGTHCSAEFCCGGFLFESTEVSAVPAEVVDAVTNYSSCSVQVVFLHVFGATLASFTICDEWSIAFGHHGLDVAHVHHHSLLHVSISVSSWD